MIKPLRHASFFSGVGGLDLGFKRAGIHTTSLCEFNPYASAVLAERFPGIPNFGDITKLTAEEIPDAEIWSGGFPCQDLSIAGKRAGFAGSRSSLAFKFLELLGDMGERSPRWIVLENVAGLFTSNEGRDFIRLIHEISERGYANLSWRILDAQHFGVPQRRKRAFIIASRVGSDCAQEVLFEPESGCGHSHAGAQISHPAASGIGSSLARGGGNRESDSAAANTHRMREIAGVGSRLEHLQELEGEGEQAYAFRKSARVSGPGTGETWVADGKANTLNTFDVGDIRTTHAVIQAYSIREDAKAGNFSATPLQVAGTLGALWPGVQSSHAQAFIIGTQGGGADELLPQGLDNHRYRVIGNGVAAPVAEWIGRRLVAVDAALQQEGI